MSAHVSLNAGLGLASSSPVDDIVDSIKGGAPTLTQFDERIVSTKTNLPAATAVVVGEAPPVEAQPAKAYIVDAWTPSTKQSPLGKTGMFALVLLAHVLAIVGIASVRDTVQVIEPQALQIAIVAAPQDKAETPPQPKIIPPPVLLLPVEPVVIDIALPDSTAITVAAKPVEASLPTSTATGTPKTVSSVDYVREPQPKYPSAARALKQRGTVTLRVLVDSSGHAREVNLHRTSGYKLLDEAARKAVLDAQFKPYMENGNALPVYVLVPIEFGTA